MNNLKEFLRREYYRNILSMACFRMGYSSENIPAETIIKNLLHTGILNKEKLLETLHNVAEDALNATIRNNKELWDIEVNKDEVIVKMKDQARSFIQNC